MKPYSSKLNTAAILSLSLIAAACSKDVDSVQSNNNQQPLAASATPAPVVPSFGTYEAGQVDLKTAIPTFTDAQVADVLKSTSKEDIDLAVAELRRRGMPKDQIKTVVWNAVTFNNKNQARLNTSRQVLVPYETPKNKKLDGLVATSKEAENHLRSYYTKVDQEIAQDAIAAAKKAEDDKAIALAAQIEANKKAEAEKRSELDKKQFADSQALRKELEAKSKEEILNEAINEWNPHEANVLVSVLLAKGATPAEVLSVIAGINAYEEATLKRLNVLKGKMMVFARPKGWWGPGEWQETPKSLKVKALIDNTNTRKNYWAITMADMHDMNEMAIAKAEAKKQETLAIEQKKRTEAAQAMYAWLKANYPRDEVSKFVSAGKIAVTKFLRAPTPKAEPVEVATATTLPSVEAEDSSIASATQPSLSTQPAPTTQPVDLIVRSQELLQEAFEQSVAADSSNEVKSTVENRELTATEVEEMIRKAFDWRNIYSSNLEAMMKPYFGDRDAQETFGQGIRNADQKIEQIEDATSDMELLKPISLIEKEANSSFTDNACITLENLDKMTVHCPLPKSLSEND